MLFRIFFILFISVLTISHAAAQYTWEVVNQDSFLQSLSCHGQFCATTGYLPAEGHSVLKSDDWGTTWTTIIPLLPDSLQNNGLRVVSRVDSAYLFAIGYDGLFLRSSDAGTTWSGKNIDLLVDLTSMHFADTLSGICIGQKNGLTRNQLYTTTDGGNSWKLIPIEHFHDLTSCYAAGDQKFKVFNAAITSIYTTEDNWETRDSVSQFDDDDDKLLQAHECAFTQGDTTIAYGSIILRTISNGQSWERTVVPIPGQFGTPIRLFAMTRIDRDTIVAGGSGNKILISYDAGTSWTIDSLILPDSQMFSAVTELVMLDNGTVMGLLSSGGFYSHIVIGKRIPASVKVEEVLSPVAVYPNPASMSITIELPHHATTLHILDALGRTVKTYDGLAAGPYQVDVSAFGPGSYQAVVRSDAGVQSTSFIVVK